MSTPQSLFRTFGTALLLSAVGLFVLVGAGELAHSHDSGSEENCQACHHQLTAEAQASPALVAVWQSEPRLSAPLRSALVRSSDDGDPIRGPPGPLA